MTLKLTLEGFCRHLWFWSVVGSASSLLHPSRAHLDQFHLDKSASELQKSLNDQVLGEKPCKTAEWGGCYGQEAKCAVDLVSAAVRLCRDFQESRPSRNNPTTEKNDRICIENKSDGSPATAVDFAIQGFVNDQLHSIYPNDRIIGEEDSNFLRKEVEILEQSLSLTNLMLMDFSNQTSESKMTREKFLEAIDRGVHDVEADIDTSKARSWVLDPIDGTHGFISGQQYVIGLALLVGEEAMLSVMGNPSRSPEIMVAVKGYGVRHVHPNSEGHVKIQAARNVTFQKDWSTTKYDYSRLTHLSKNGWGSGAPSWSLLPLIAGVDYPPFLLSRPISSGSPLPFGPLCPPSNLCCGSQAKYFAIARGEAAGFIQLQASSLKVWDHAPGILCVKESGGNVLDARGQDIRFEGREFSVAKGIICCAREADSKTRELLMASVQATKIVSSAGEES